MKPKNRVTTYGIIFWLMIYSLFTFTIGQFIPIYFTNPDFRIYFYPFILLIAVITVAITAYRSMYLPHKNDWMYSSIISLITTILVFVIFFGITLVKVLAVWTDATTLFVKKNDPQVRIVTRYINEGAYGGGTQAADYDVVVSRPLTLLPSNYIYTFR